MPQITYTTTQLGPEDDAAFDIGLDKVRGSVGSYGLLIGEDWRSGAQTFVERNPARLDEVLGRFADASNADVDEAVTQAHAAQHRWARTAPEDRLAVLERAAQMLEARIGEFAAMLTLEVGKNRVESMGEVVEAVELVRYYGRQLSAGFDLPLTTGSAASENRSVMLPFGVFGVIAPFNFPLALVLGPAAAALVAGNTVVVKPAPTTSRVAVLLAEVLLEAGLPAGAFNLVTGGDATGRALVSNPRLDGVVFTGSHGVGRQIASTFFAAGTYPRPAIIEMGGKNPTIVTANADLEKAAAGIVRSAFGLSGQRCSACSRVLVHRSVQDELVEALVERTADLVVADPIERTCSLGPVHSKDSFTRFRRNCGDVAVAGRILVGGGLPRSDALPRGFYVEPTIVAGLPPMHRLTRDEQFVPMLTIETTSSFDDALRSANDPIYGLTAGLFSEDQQEIEAFLEGIEAGTIFVNRAAGATSGGWPGQQSYVGWKGSGSTSRGALGPRYVAQFLREQGRNVVL